MPPPQPFSDAEAYDEPEIRAALTEARECGFREGFGEGARADWIFEVCFDGVVSMEQAGRRLAALAYLQKFQSAPAKTVRGLATLWGVSPGRAYEILTSFERISEQSRRNWPVAPRQDP